MNRDLRRILVKGGAMSPFDIKQVVELAQKLGYETIYFGSRQDILFPFDNSQDAVIKDFPNLQIECIANRKYQNIVSSYVAADILPATSWLKSSSYLYILEQFNYHPKLEINITDPKQRLVPLFSGHLNFIASHHEDYWFLYVRFPNTEETLRYPVLIHSWDIGKVSRTIEQIINEVDDPLDLFNIVTGKLDANNRTIDKDLHIPFHPFPYYEGMNKMGIDQYWLGLYWRNNRYDLKFLDAMADLCLECKIGKICLTPWKSFIIKGIPEKHKLEWEKLLGMYGINVRHSSLELNWHLPVNNREALELKRYLVRNFDQNDISTYGLTFGIFDGYGTKFTSIVIQKNPTPQVVKEFVIRPTYNVQYCEDFDPNNRNYIIYAQDVDKIELPCLLMELSRLYFEQLGEEKTTETTIAKMETATSVHVAINAYQCPDCLSLYDSLYGDELAGIASGTPFEQLPEDYECPVCSAPKETFGALAHLVE